MGSPLGLSIFMCSVFTYLLRYEAWGDVKDFWHTKTMKKMTLQIHAHVYAVFLTFFVVFGSHYGPWTEQKERSVPNSRSKTLTLCFEAFSLFTYLLTFFDMFFQLIALPVPLPRQVSKSRFFSTFFRLSFWNRFGVDFGSIFRRFSGLKSQENSSKNRVFF